MSAEEKKALVRRYVEEFVASGDLSRAEEYIAPEYGSNSGVSGPEGYRRIVQQLHAAFPDLRVTIDYLIAEGDWVVMGITRRGTHLGEHTEGGITVPPTGKQVAWQSIHLRRIANGKLVEGFGISDSLGLLRQLGAIPAPDSAAR